MCKRVFITVAAFAESVAERKRPDVQKGGAQRNAPHAAISCWIQCITTCAMCGA
jgi:hypothetical protein